MREARVLRYREGAVIEGSATSYRAGVVALRLAAEN